MLISELQEKLEKVKQEFGDVEVYTESWSNVYTNSVCLVKDLYNDSFVVYITDDAEGLATMTEDEDLEVIREF